MICPLFMAAAVTKGPPLEVSEYQCEETGCAWWDDENDLCSVRNLSRNLNVLTFSIEEIRKDGVNQEG